MDPLVSLERTDHPESDLESLELLVLMPNYTIVFSLSLLSVLVKLPLDHQDLLALQDLTDPLETPDPTETTEDPAHSAPLDPLAHLDSPVHPESEDLPESLESWCPEPNLLPDLLASLERLDLPAFPESPEHPERMDRMGVPEDPESLDREDLLVLLELEERTEEEEKMERGEHATIALLLDLLLDIDSSLCDREIVLTDDKDGGTKRPITRPNKGA